MFSNLWNNSAYTENHVFYSSPLREVDRLFMGQRQLVLGAGP